MTLSGGNMRIIIVILIAIFLFCVIFTARMKRVISKKNVEIDTLKDEIEKQREFYSIFTRWLNIHNHGKNLASFFDDRGFRNIAIYGMKETGELLLSELRENGINVSYGIDRDADNLYVKTVVIKPTEEIRDVDAIVVTAIHYYKQIENELKGKINCPIISLRDILYEISLIK